MTPEELSNDLYALEKKAESILTKEEYKFLDNVLNQVVNDLINKNIPLKERYNIYTEIINEFIRKSKNNNRKFSLNLTDYIEKKK